MRITMTAIHISHQPKKDSNMYDPSVNAAITAALEATINKALQYDPGTFRALKKLDHSCLSIRITQPELRFYILINNHYVKIQSYMDEHVRPPDIILTGKLRDLARLKQGNIHNFADSGVSVEGNARDLITYQEIFSTLDIDWEEWINDHLGNLAGHQLSNAIKKGSRWLLQQKTKIELHSVDYLTDEFQLVPASSEIQTFLSDVDTIKAQFDRLNARTNKLVNARRNMTKREHGHV